MGSGPNWQEAHYGRNRNGRAHSPDRPPRAEIDPAELQGQIPGGHQQGHGPPQHRGDPHRCARQSCAMWTSATDLFLPSCFDRVPCRGCEEHQRCEEELHSSSVSHFQSHQQNLILSDPARIPLGSKVDRATTEWDDQATMEAKSWECHRCHRVNAPHCDRCDCTAPAQTEPFTPTVPGTADPIWIVCSCHTPFSACPIHGLTYPWWQPPTVTVGGTGQLEALELKVGATRITMPEPLPTQSFESFDVCPPDCTTFDPTNSK